MPTTPGSARERWRTSGARVALAIAVLGICVRLVVALWLVPLWEQRSGLASSPDHYPTLALSLLRAHQLGYLAEGASPTTIRGPGYPLWLAAGMACGISDTRWLGVWTALPSIALATAFAAWLTRRLGARCGLLFGAVALLHPLPAFISARTMSDEFYAVLGLAAPWAWVAATEALAPRRRWLLVAGSGLLVGLDVLTRSTGVITVLAMLGWSLRARRHGWRELTLFMLLALAPALVWSVRSSRLEGRLVFVHSLAGYNFWYGEALDRLPPDDVRGRNHQLAVEQILRLGGSDPAQAPRFWYGTLTPHQVAALESRLTSAARDSIVKQPLQYALRVMRGIGWFWVRAETKTRTWQYTGVIAPVLLLAIYGAYRGVCLHDRSLRALSVLAVTIVLAHNLLYAATFPAARMCVQIFPLLTLLAVIGAQSLARIRRR